MAHVHVAKGEHLEW